VQRGSRTGEYPQHDEDRGYAEGRGVPGVAKDHFGEDDGDREADDATGDSTDPQHSRRSVSGRRGPGKRLGVLLRHSSCGGLRRYLPELGAVELGGILGAIIGFVLGVVIEVAFWNDAAAGQTRTTFEVHNLQP
jgi:hypothetical protein